MWIFRWFLSSFSKMGQFISGRNLLPGCHIPKPITKSKQKPCTRRVTPRSRSKSNFFDLKSIGAKKNPSKTQYCFYLYWMSQIQQIWILFKKRFELMSVVVFSMMLKAWIFDQIFRRICFHNFLLHFRTFECFVLIFIRYSSVFGYRW